MKNAKFYCTDVDSGFLADYNRLRDKPNAILVDPPRSGMSKALCEGLASIEGASDLFYISCDPATLARDVKILTANNAWKLERIACFDMFARTKHIETMALFRKADK